VDDDVVAETDEDVTATVVADVDVKVCAPSVGFGTVVLQ
jgi:hypothetical protein